MVGVLDFRVPHWSVGGTPVNTKIGKNRIEFRFRPILVLPAAFGRRKRAAPVITEFCPK